MVTEYMKYILSVVGTWVNKQKFLWYGFDPR